SQKISLPGIMTEALVGKICQHVACKIQNGERLLVAFGVGSESAVQKYHEAAIGRDRRSRRQIVDLARVTGNLSEHTAIRQLRRRGGVLSRELNWREHKNCRGERQWFQAIVFEHRESLQRSA